MSGNDPEPQEQTGIPTPDEMQIVGHSPEIRSFETLPKAA